jgi:hypothetical protein
MASLVVGVVVAALSTTFILGNGVEVGMAVA